MALIDELTKDEVAKLKELNAKLMDSVFLSDIDFYTKEMHRLLDQVENRVRENELEQAELKGFVKGLMTKTLIN